MKISSILLYAFLCVANVCMGQRDTIYLANEKLVVTIKEVSEDAVRFTYPKEDIINSIFKNIIQKVVFASGRVQTFSEITNYKNVRSIADWDLVSISGAESEIRGLYKLADVSAKAKGATTFSGMERIKERAFKKLKTQATMFGGNIIYMTQLNSAGAHVGYWSSKGAETSLSGIAYSNVIPDQKGFEKLVADGKLFPIKDKVILSSNSTGAVQGQLKGNLNLSEIITEGKLFYVVGKINNGKEMRYRVVRYNEDSFTIVFEDKNTLYNYTLGFN